MVHLSDEEGLDGDDLYAQLPATCQIWRNFPHPRFRSDSRVSSFPIGPRDLFLGKDDLMAGIPSSKRPFPWAFMGTLWASGSRTVAVSHFLRSLPQGFFYGGKSFGMGLPLLQYRYRLMQSVFALAPEGDRHLDTFRLWESLCCGCIPLVVDHDSSAEALLGSASSSCNNAGLPWLSPAAATDTSSLNHLQACIRIACSGPQRDFEAGFCP